MPAARCPASRHGSASVMLQATSRLKKKHSQKLEKDTLLNLFRLGRPSNPETREQGVRMSPGCARPAAERGRQRRSRVR